MALNTAIGVHWLQLATGLLWLIPVVLFRAIWGRIRRRKASATDWLVAGYPAIGFIQMCFSAPWWIFPGALGAMANDEVAYWFACYVGSGLCVIFVWIAYGIWSTRS